ncbi:long-chain fatty aldehyde decarbonylase [Synechococcus sp. GreenBA-s]|nr:long-chain fatty aldehyde decarbonylase [Synechococcus sp. GreenBA-s]
MTSLQSVAFSGAPAPSPDPTSPVYRDAYSRINGVVVVGEGLADRHFRLLARAIPEDGAELLRLGAMEGRHARDFIGCGANLGVRPDAALAKQLFAPLHALFQECDRSRDLAGCLVIQCLIVECFAVAAYRAYLPVADAYAQPITAAVLADEAEHLNYGEQWLQGRFAEVAEAVAAICRSALPVTLQILQAVAEDMRTIGMDPSDLVGAFCELFEQSLVTIGFSGAEARRLVFRSVAAVSLG